MISYATFKFGHWFAVNIGTNNGQPQASIRRGHEDHATLRAPHSRGLLDQLRNNGYQPPVGLLRAMQDQTLTHHHIDFGLPPTTIQLGASRFLSHGGWDESNQRWVRIVQDTEHNPGASAVNSAAELLEHVQHLPVPHKAPVALVICDATDYGERFELCEYNEYNGGFAHIKRETLIKDLRAPMLRGIRGEQRNLSAWLQRLLLVTHARVDGQTPKYNAEQTRANIIAGIQAAPKPAHLDVLALERALEVWIKPTGLPLPERQQALDTIHAWDIIPGWRGATT